MTLHQIAGALVAHCRAGTEAEALDSLYAPDAVSVEMAEIPGLARETRGLDGIRAKHAWWAANFTVHASAVEGPFLHQPDRFAVIFDVDATHRESGRREAMREVALYTLREGRIIREEFFGIPPGAGSGGA